MDAVEDEQAVEALQRRDRREQRPSLLALVPAMLELLLDASEPRAAAQLAAASAAKSVEHVLVGGQSMVGAQRARAC